MESTSLALFPFAGQPCPNALRECLDGLGYAVQVCGTDSGLPDGVRGIAVFLFGDYPCSRLRVFSTLAAAGRLPRLGIFAAGEGPRWDSDLADLCDEAASWPCSARELAFRLQRLNRVHGSGIDANRPAGGASEPSMIGRSPAFARTMERIVKFTGCDAPVLIEGETGTGKELAARTIHYLGTRRSYPFIPVNCGALPENLIENELFGHEKGAYTDAKAARKGLIAQAMGGTVFLDEVEALPPKAQVALLRFLQEKEYRPVGSDCTHRADVRVIAASNACLAGLAQAGAFRHDLLFRLNIMPVVIPPLRERVEDIALLAEHFLRLYRARYGQPGKVLHPDTLTLLGRYDWPGNVRELENFIHREFVLAEGDVVRADPCGGQPGGTDDGIAMSEMLDMDFNQAKARAIESFERGYLASLLAEAGGNVSRAARMAGKERRALGKLVKKYGIDRADYQR